MGTPELDIVVGLLVHVGGLSTADNSAKSRIIDSVAPVKRSAGIWQARDNYVGASWLIALGHEYIYKLASPDMYGNSWKEYKPSTRTEIVEVQSGSVLRVKAVVASFHDTKHDIAPPALLQVDKHFIYRNVSGHFVPIDADIVYQMLELNGVRL
jgi:hypothetical protein